MNHAPTAGTLRRPPLLLLGIASSLSPFGMAVIVPAMNSIALRYDAGLPSVQFVISAYLFGLAAAQPVMGHLCDRFGRRPVMLAGFAVFVFASFACALATSLELLIGARFLQAVGTSAGTVASRAILRDTCDGDDLATGMSYIAAAMGAAPIVAPIMGGLIDTHATLPWVFVATAAIGALVLLSMLLRLPETLPPNSPRPDGRRLFSNYGVLLGSRAFLGNTFLYGFIQGSFFCFLAVGATYFLSTYGMGSQTFGIVWGAMAIAYVIGAAAGAQLTGRIGGSRLIKASVVLSLATATGLVGLSLSEPVPMAGAIRPHPDMAGTASGLSSATGLVLSGLFTVGTGLIYTGPFLPVALLVLLACSLAAGGWLLAGSARQGATISRN